MSNDSQMNDKFMAGLSPTVIDRRRHATVSHASTRDRIMIEINESDKPEDSKDAFVQVNGRAYQIQRGAPVGVPPEVVGVLENAVIDRAVPTIDPVTGIPAGITLRPTRRYPFQFADAESQAQYKAWKKQSTDFRDAQIEAEQQADEVLH